MEEYGRSSASDRRLAGWLGFL
ncbi:hypothetical protein CCACVL1_19634 [Corchorus capsularis]|uniref:Uncharacterized protein n=1 Tax=Corchorus capsularis TaxID=210143 RepID=A0A1R3HFN1_COCAP|nr:hypothetical protein CCACVL1_19634 [Corchorus capsularis]